jgi:hypothetical protein
VALLLKNNKSHVRADWFLYGSCFKEKEVHCTSLIGANFFTWVKGTLTRSSGQ